MHRRLLLLVLFAVAMVFALRAYRPAPATVARAPVEAAPDLAADGWVAPLTSPEAAIDHRDERPRHMFGVPPAAMPEACGHRTDCDRTGACCSQCSRYTPSRPWSATALIVDFQRQVRGDAAARAWLQAQVPHGWLNAASLVFYRRHEWSLLWEMIPEPERGPYPSTVWLYRAAAAVQEGLAPHPHRADLLAYYARASVDPSDIMGSLPGRPHRRGRHPGTHHGAPTGCARSATISACEPRPMAATTPATGCVSCVKPASSTRASTSGLRTC